MNYWLVKQEPAEFSWDDFLREKRTVWTGVRNYQARNNLRQMQKGDLTLFYHSVTEKQIVGVAKVIKAAYPDPSATGGDWSAVDLKPVKSLTKPLPLQTIKADPILRGMPLVRQSRLSVLPLSEDHFQRILELSQTDL